LGAAVLRFCGVPGRLADGIFRSRRGGCRGLGQKLWTVATACFWEILGVNRENSVSNEENFQKNGKFYKNSLCNRKKMGYNKKKKPQTAERSPS